MSRIIIFASLWSLCILAREPIGANRYEALTGFHLLKEVSPERSDFVTSDGQHPSKFLVDNYHYIPKGATVLKIGLEGGLNSIFLARKGYKVVGIDSDSENVKKSLRRAKEFGVRIEAILSEIESYYIAENSFDAIICFREFNSKVYNKILRGVKPGGILIFSKERETKTKVRAGKLIRKYRGLEVLKYEAPIRFNDYNASIILER